MIRKRGYEEEREYALWLSHRLRRIRHLSGFTQQEVTKAMGWKYQSILSRYECGNGLISLFECTRLAALYGIAINKLILRCAVNVKIGYVDDISILAFGCLEGLVL